ncbi:MAG: hypothetical protein M1827_003395 [Pycnora praestabilis]|nr:MAG: hypothetical protein M1827_003395 [Pycnora praestabilis]
MVLEVIYVTRHGFRSNWVVDPQTGTYCASVRSPTNIPSDPPLAGYGEEQAKQLAKHILTLDPPVDRIYSSPFYRCLQTLTPVVEKLGAVSKGGGIRGENGIGEWYGTARFDHPSPATPSLLRTFFPTYSLTHTPAIIPSTNGETIVELHDRTAYALSCIIADLDAEPDQPKTLLLCTHAATLIALGRALTGRMPEDSEEVDFKPFTCGISKFVRRKGPVRDQEPEIKIWLSGQGNKIPMVDWRGGKGVGGGWDCVINGDCSFLKGGEERGWHFSGDESFSTSPEPEPHSLDVSSKGGIHDGESKATSKGDGDRCGNSRL